MKFKIDDVVCRPDDKYCSLGIVENETYGFCWVWWGKKHKPDNFDMSFRMRESVDSNEIIKIGVL